MPYNRGMARTPLIIGRPARPPLAPLHAGGGRRYPHCRSRCKHLFRHTCRAKLARCRQKYASACRPVPELAYDAYGNNLGFDPATALTKLLYSGEQFDQRIAMQYLRARYYDLSTGRFNRLDPYFGKLADPQSLHKYLYVHGDPISGVDPTGEEKTLASLQGAMTTFMTRVKVRVASVFSAGAAAIGRFFNEIGTRTQQLANAVLQSFPRLQVLQNQPVGRRFIDFIVRRGDRVAQIEVKYSIPQRTGDAFTRLCSQIQEMVASGQGQAVVWSMRPPTVAQLNRIMNTVGPEIYNATQFCHGFEGLVGFIRLYFGT